ncbi:hypothetical protein [Pseudemcibacter aquimaris]|uniref:hypothetical protein n=1 Tax=Pseudemcibacter aquimaris TaxID=2857064 RepID=UPI0020121BF4|nr:hypothetical protein [Pseudemcibacter aquimaris]MCC3860793.1 hypothetical protein [Pseudemcibacter aquimaris]WDU59613.1 hypothetical protein KW060_04980 [Pseudemcibacter aquimaris]
MSENKGARSRQVVTAHPSSVKHSNTNELPKKSFVRNWPVTLSSLLSVIWLSVCIFYLANSSYEFGGNIVEIASLIMGVSAPIIIIWMICLVILRINPIEENRRALETGLDQLLSPVEVTQDRINKVIENMQQEIEKIDAAGDQATDKFNSLKEQIEQLSTISENSISGIDASADNIAKKATAMEEAVKSVTEKSKKSITEASEHYTETVNELGNITGKIEEQITQGLDDVQNNLSENTNAMRDNISEHFQSLETEVDQGNSRMGELLSGNLDTIETHVRDTLSTIQSQSEKIESTLEETKKHIQERSDSLGNEHQLFKEFANEFSTRIEGAEEEFNKQHKNILSCVNVIEDGLAVAIDKMNNNSTRLGAHGQKIIENILSLSADVNDQIIDIQNRSKNGIREIENASLKASENLINQEENTTSIINTWLNAANHVRREHAENMKKLETMLEEVATIERSTAKSVHSSEDKIKRISNDLLRTSDRIHVASNAAVEAVEETNYALDQNAEKYQQMINAIQFSSQSLATNAEAIEKRLKRINAERFSDVSEKIMEKLQSGSIDIAKYLDGDIPKELWDKYISGDKNLFIRRIKKHIGKKTTAELRKHYLEDRDFRMNTDSFLQLFEEMLGTFTENSDDLYRETLVTSDVGKVYFVLADATGRLNS